MEVGEDRRLDQFRNRVFRYLDGDYTVFDIAEEFGLTFDFVYSYLREFEEKGLISARPVVDRN